MHKTIRIEAIHAGYAAELVDAYEEMRKHACDDCSEYGSEPKTYSIADGVGIYKIDGPLLSSGNAFTRWFGYADYEGIRNDLLAMAKDPEVQEILVMMASPGGSVFGVSNASEAFKKVGAVKDIYVYTGKNCCSGAYWLAAGAKEIIAAPEAELGSIGVIVTHFSYQKQIEEDGVKVTVIKTAELKAVGGPYTDLTEKEISHIQAQAEQYDDLFHEHIQATRPSVKLSSMKGQTFIGAEAVRMGLADAVMSYDDAIQHIRSQRKTTQTGGYNMKMTAEKLRAALDAGETLATLGLTEEEGNEILASAPEVDGGELEVDAAKKGGKKGGKGGGCADPEAGEGETEGGAAMMSMPQAEFDVMVAELEGTKVSLAAAEATATKATAAAEKMRTIVSEVFNNRRVAMGLNKIDVSAMSLETLLSDYEATTTEFNKSFKIGGSLAQKPAEPPKSVVSDSVHAGHLQAAA